MHDTASSRSDKRLALVTGGTRGIGRAICEALQPHYDVVANYAEQHQTAERFSKETGIPVYAWDVRDMEACARYSARITEQHGKPISILVNNAGISRDGMLHKSHHARWDEVIHTNLSSCYYMCRAVIEGMREQAFGRIINISSVIGQMGGAALTNYAASKAGMIGFTKAMALESAPKGITVNVVAPGYIDTDLLAHLSETVRSGIVNAIPMKRLGAPHEVARCVAFLAHPDAGFITGETIAVNGGQYMH